MIVSFNQLENIRNHHRSQMLVLTSGTFDLFHIGHLDYLENVKKYGDVLVVMLSGDKRVRARKGTSRPIINEKDRARILDGLKIVDYVFFDTSRLNPKEVDPIHATVLKKLNPDFYVTDGPDPRFYNLLDKNKFVILERLRSEPSTTSIIGKIRNLP